VNVSGPASTRWTHVALPVRDLPSSLDWYARWTPLVCVHDRSDEEGRTAWLGHPIDPAAPAHPFVLVLIEKTEGFDDVATVLGPLAHLGFEMTSRRAVDAIAEQARAEGVLHWDVTDHGPPVGYICAIVDPDGNVVEFSHDQGVYAAAQRPAPPPDQASSASV
jgi:catechol 2,3-dioxygenase-like lactoylglutathione lyase family enzyme